MIRRASSSVYFLKVAGAFLAAPLLLAISVHPGIISLVRIEEEQEEVLRNAAQYGYSWSSVFKTMGSALGTWRSWVPMILLFLVCAISPLPKASRFFRVAWLVAKVAIILAFEFTKSIGYTACTSYAECGGSIYGETPTRIFQVYVVLILLSSVLLMDRSFRYDVEGQGSDTSESTGLGSDDIASAATF